MKCQVVCYVSLTNGSYVSLTNEFIWTFALVAVLSTEMRLFTLRLIFTLRFLWMQLMITASKEITLIINTTNYNAVNTQILTNPIRWLLLLLNWLCSSMYMMITKNKKAASNRKSDKADINDLTSLKKLIPKLIKAITSRMIILWFTSIMWLSKLIIAASANQININHALNSTIFHLLLLNSL